VIERYRRPPNENFHLVSTLEKENR
jgi:hypothetical protein